MTTLHSDIDILLSTTTDGSLRSSLVPEPEISETTTHAFLAAQGISLHHTTLLRLSYDGDDFCKYHEVSNDEIGAGFVRSQDKVADALVTRQSGVVLFLPIADCIGTVLYHPPTQTLMLSHLGRHNLEQYGGTKSVEYLKQYGVNPKELLVYLSPAASSERYPLYTFEYRSLHDVATSQLQDAGVQQANITVDGRDTVTDPDFFSHSAALRGEKQAGRHAIACMIKSINR